MRVLEGVGPSTSANLGSLFDIAGVAVNAFYDKVRLEPLEDEERLELRVVGREAANVSRGEANLALRTLRLALEECPPGEGGVGFSVLLEKNVPVGRGLGSSAATVAAVLRAYRGLAHCPGEKIVSIAGRAEGLVSGSVHYDNVVPSLVGGLVVMGGIDRDPPVFHVFEWPRDVLFVLGVPGAGEVDREEKTKRMRQALPQEYSFREMTVYQSYGALLLTSLFKRDLESLGKAASYGGVIEEVRSKWIKGYWDMKRKALEAGALGFNISGAGPSVFALVKRGEEEPVRDAIEGVASKHYGEYEVVVAEALEPREL